MTPLSSSGWTFLTNHAQVLLCIAEDPDARIRDIAARVGITERATQRIVTELETDGYLSHSRVGRRNHYRVHTDQPLRHRLTPSLQVETLLKAFEVERTS